MKHINLFLLIIIFSPLSILALEGAQDSTAKVILDKVSNQLNSHSSIIADFEILIDNRMDDLHTKSKGTIQIKGNKYYMESMGTEVYFNGKTMWSFMPDINEVTITEPNTEEGDFVDNPALIFSFYNRDFKYRLIGEVNVEKVWMYEIDLYPKNLNQPYSRFKLYIDKADYDIYMVKAISKDAIDYTVYILNTKYDSKMDNTTFEFEIDNYQDIEIIDMRF